MLLQGHDCHGVLSAEAGVSEHTSSALTGNSEWRSSWLSIFRMDGWIDVCDGLRLQDSFYYVWVYFYAVYMQMTADAYRAQKRAPGLLELELQTYKLLSFGAGPNSSPLWKLHMFWTFALAPYSPMDSLFLTCQFYSILLWEIWGLERAYLESHIAITVKSWPGSPSLNPHTHIKSAVCFLTLPLSLPRPMYLMQQYEVWAKTTSHKRDLQLWNLC